MAMTPEGKVKADVKEFLKARHIWYCMPIGSGFGNSGVPDFLCCHNGRFVAIETKALGKRANTTVLQDKQIMGIHQSGGVAVVVDQVSQLEGIFG